ncbi:uncharacterized protein A4U43_UnF10540 [Asparagus officinalis]|uniref:Bulb-type lectin domain-containing protein n=1 Tax=Asparagus officinalis TaxID=4686 RepID=A0A1R3L5F9_ASPOF|nr:uncharacterized protein A4U43_UnF10540 [Asparagus officinalis]
MLGLFDYLPTFSVVTCGFFCNRIDYLGCDSFVYAAIFLHRSSYPAPVIWSANRDHPVGENATLHFSQDDNLFLKDAGDNLVWSTNIVGKSVVGMRLSKEGRLELFDSSNAKTEDSFYYLTDSWVLGQTLKEGHRLIANVSAMDWSRDGRALLDEVLIPDPLFGSSQRDNPQVSRTMDGLRVAMKRLDGVGQGAKEFLAEVKTIGNVQHINVVRLIGFCSEKSHRLLVYEYMCNGSLDKWIFYKSGDDPLDWQT